jgi:hypothetical protein
MKGNKITTIVLFNLEVFLMTQEEETVFLEPRQHLLAHLAAMQKLGLHGLENK